MHLDTGSRYAGTCFRQCRIRAHREVRPDSVPISDIGTHLLGIAAVDALVNSMLVCAATLTNQLATSALYCLHRVLGLIYMLDSPE
ncbi:hypothetical protein CPB85DRAFT_190709 [Mucidula mucida]|nr:hypothetical protein CPB85DRAFT_190709 [Mucidula mucida]